MFLSCTRTNKLTHIQPHTHIHTCALIHARARAHTHTHTHSHTHTHTHTHTQTHTHTHTNQSHQKRAGAKGMGLFALEDVQAGNFIIEYIGEVLEEEEYLRRKDFYAQVSRVHKLVCVRTYIRACVSFNMYVLLIVCSLLCVRCMHSCIYSKHFTPHNYNGYPSFAPGRPAPLLLHEHWQW